MSSIDDVAVTISLGDLIMLDAMARTVLKNGVSVQGHEMLARVRAVIEVERFRTYEALICFNCGYRCEGTC